MPYPLSSQFNKDIDFFILDKDQNIFHFASAGTLLPDIIVQNYKENNRIQSEMLKNEELFQVEIIPNLEDFIQFESIQMREIYLRDFIFYAQRGCYSYDKTYITDFNDPRYHLVASPIKDSKYKDILHSELFENLTIQIDLDKKNTININVLK